MRPSLQQRLSLMLGGALLLAALIATSTSFYLAYGEAREFQDDMLRQVALLELGAHAATAGANGHPPRTDALNDPESRLQVYRIPDTAAPPWLHAGLGSGFHTIDTADARLRVFLYQGRNGRISIAAQPTDARNEIALDSALRTLLPLVLLLPVIALLVVRIVRSALAPINTLARDLDAQPAGQPSPLPDQDIPQEIVPFVHAINRLLGRIGELLGQQRRFIADAAHELRSPLTALSIQAQNLEQAKSTDDLRTRVGALRTGIERARKLTEQLLSLARTQADRAEPGKIELSSLIRELIAERLTLAEQRSIDLGMEELAHLSVLGSPEALRLIIGNALENALKYAPGGSEVTVKLYRNGQDAIVDVIDTGPGIPDAERARVFDPFYRSEGATGTGSGLGLAIAREAANSLQGAVALLSPADGHGLIFRYRQRAAPPQ